MAKTVARYKVDVFWKNNLQSAQRVKKEIERTQGTIERARKKARVRGEGEIQRIVTNNLQKTYNKQIKREMDLYKIKSNNQKKLDAQENSRKGSVNMTESARRKQAVQNITEPTGAERMRSFYAAQEKESAASMRRQEREAIANNKKINNLKDRQAAAVAQIKNRMRGVNREEKQAFIKQINQTKTVQELARTKTRIQGEVTDILRVERQISREMGQQNFLQQRLTASVYQMVGGIGSAYLAWEGLKRTVSTGIDYEGIERAFQVISMPLLPADATDQMVQEGIQQSLRKTGEEMEYVRGEAERLGLPFRQAAKGYMSLVAAMNTKLNTDEIRQIFEGINEAGAALGLSEEGLQRITLAVKQMGSKGKIQAEELTQQLGEQLPIALRALAKATADAGLIDGSMSQQKQEAAVYKLMENGKLLSDQILPNLGKAFHDIATQGGLLEKALSEGLQRPLVTMRNNFDQITNSYYLGLKPALRGLFSDTSNIMKSLKGLSTVLGRLSGGLIQGFTFVPRLVSAAISDIAYYFGMANDLTGELVHSIENIGTRVIGFGLGIMAFVWAIRKLADSLGLLKSAGKLVGSVKDSIGKKGGVGGGGSARGLGYSGQLNTIIAELRQIAINTGGSAATDAVTGGGDSKKSPSRRGGKWGGRLDKLVLSAGVGYVAMEAFSQVTDFLHNVFNPTEWMGNKMDAYAAAGLITQQQAAEWHMQNQDVNVNVNLKHPMLEAEIDRRVDTKQQDMIDQASQHYQNR